jgi:hypothetical protein
MYIAIWSFSEFDCSKFIPMDIYMPEYASSLSPSFVDSKLDKRVEYNSQTELKAKRKRTEKGKRYWYMSYNPSNKTPIL